MRESLTSLTSSESIRILRVFACVTGVCLVTALCGCGSKPSATAERPETKTAELPTETIHISQLADLQSAGVGAESRTGNTRTVASNKQWAYAATVPVRYGGQKGVLQLRVRVAKGKMGFGLIDSTNQFLTEQFVLPSADFQQISLALAPTGKPQTLIVRSAADNGSLSEATVESLDLLLPATRLPNAVSVSQVEPTNAAAMIERGNPVRVITARDRYSYGASFPLTLGNASGALILCARARVVRGRIGIGVLTRDLKEFQAEEYVGPGLQSAAVIMPIPSPATAGSVVVKNGNDGISEVLIDDVTVYSLRQLP